MILVKKHTALSFCIVFTLCFTVLLPSAIQFTHLFENHEHKSCGDITTHLHEKEFECSIQSFHLNSFSFQIFEYPDFFEKVTFIEKIDHYKNETSNKNFSYFLLRGPPFNF
jgi:hypothetical protein